MKKNNNRDKITTTALDNYHNDGLRRYGRTTRNGRANND